MQQGERERRLKNEEVIYPAMLASEVMRIHVANSTCL